MCRGLATIGSLVTCRSAENGWAQYASTLKKIVPKMIAEVLVPKEHPRAPTTQSMSGTAPALAGS